jgi:hypothetical protein
MRTRNELERLEAAGRPLLVETESLVNADEEERILERILAEDRPRHAGRKRMTRRRRAALLVVGAALAAVVVAVASIGHGTRSANVSKDPHRFVLSGSPIQLAGYRFKTPAGFKASGDSCVPSSSSVQVGANGFAAAASADGGCVEAFYLIASADSASPIRESAYPVGVGSYQGYFVPPDSSGRSTLYVELPMAGGDQNHVYLLLLARGLTEDQLVAVAVSGLPG